MTLHIEERNLIKKTHGGAILKIKIGFEEQSDAAIYFLGGTVKRGFHCTVGTEVVNSLDKMCVDKCFIGTTGISVERGITNPDVSHSEIRRCMLRISRQTIVLADSQKIGINSFSVIASLNDIDVFITDDGINQQDIKDFEEAGIDIRIA